MAIVSMGESITPGGRRIFRVVYQGAVDGKDGERVVAAVAPGTAAFELPQLYVYEEGASMTAELREAFGKVKVVGKNIAIVMRSIPLRVQMTFVLRVIGAEGVLFETEEAALKWLDS